MNDNSAAIFGTGNHVPKEYFTGEAYLTTLIAPDNNNEYAVGSVRFSAGARTNWHTHPKGQNLLVTEGSGFYQEKGKPARQITKGDVVIIPENVQHWHGASENSVFTHIAITNFKGKENVTWLQPVTDPEYHSVTNPEA